MWKDGAATKPRCHAEVKLEKYDHAFLSSPDHPNEFEELEESAIVTDFPNKKQRIESDTSYTELKHSNFYGNGESVKQYEGIFTI